MITRTLRKTYSWGPSHKSQGLWLRNRPLLSWGSSGRGLRNKHPDLILFQSSGLLVPAIGWTQLAAQDKSQLMPTLQVSSQGAGQGREGWKEIYRAATTSLIYLLMLFLPLGAPSHGISTCQMLPVFYLLLRFFFTKISLMTFFCQNTQCVWLRLITSPFASTA